MTGYFLLDFAALSISLFNTLLLTWLGLTVLFNADRRNWGLVLAVCGLLAGAGFFVSHSLILGMGTGGLIAGFQFWWPAGWATLIAAPYAWYLLMLWYSGYWEDSHSALHRRQRSWLFASIVYTLILGGLLLFANPLPGLASEARLEVGRLAAPGSLPLLLLAYPPYILIALGLALDALLRPAPAGRPMGEAARRRARPWLVGATLTLLLVSLLVSGIFVWLVQAMRAYPGVTDLIAALSFTLSILDLILLLLLMAAVLLLGQAIVSYEIFTGQTLPRRGLFKQWRMMLLISACLSLLAAWGTESGAPEAAALLAILLFTAGSYAFFIRQSYAERQASIRSLRPFVSSQGLFERILAPSGASRLEVDLVGPFSTLCREVLGANRAALLPLGTLAALGVPPLCYPPDKPGLELPPGGRSALAALATSPEALGIPLHSTGPGEAAWAVPLWSERGPVGLLLLGEKKEGEFYSQEELEIARASGERLADLLASAELARRLAALQRQRLAESAVLDRQARRVLHDEILPRLHAALLGLSGSSLASNPEGQEALDLLAGAHREIADLLRALPARPIPQMASLGLVGALRQVLEGELAGAFDSVDWEIEPGAESRARALPELKAEVAYYAAREALRNAARHARPTESGRQLHLKITVRWCERQPHAGLELSIEDNGVGLALAPPPGAYNGSGQGLALHSTLLAILGGELVLESVPEEFTRVCVRLRGEDLQPNTPI